MTGGDDHLTAYYASLTNIELLERCSGELTDVARGIAEAELRLRGLDSTAQRASPAPEASLVASSPSASSTDTMPEADDDLVIVAHDLTPTAATLIREHLEGNGLDAIVTDAHLGGLFGWSLTGANVRVARSDEPSAREMIAAFEESLRSSAIAEDHPQEDSVTPTADSQQEDTSGLRTFRHYHHPGKNTILIVKDGFSWGAFIFGPLWFLVHRLWFVALVTMVLSIAGQTFFMSRLPYGASDIGFWLFFLTYWALWILIGKVANALLSADIEARGYVLQSVVRAANATDARYASSCTAKDDALTPMA